MSIKIEKWLKALPVKSIEKELDELRRERQDIDQKIEVREQALAMKRSFSEGSGEASAKREHGPLTSPSIRAINPPFRGREAIRKVLAATPEKETWTIAEMLRAILDRGWPTNTHAVQVNLSRMYRDGELSRVGVGLYCQPDTRRRALASTQEVQE